MVGRHCESPFGIVVSRKEENRIEGEQEYANLGGK